MLSCMTHKKISNRFVYYLTFKVTVLLEYFIPVLEQ